MTAFTPQAVINNMTGRTARRFFQFIDPSIVADWDDDSVFAPMKASDCFDSLDKERQRRFFLSLHSVFRTAASEANLETLRERLIAHGIAIPPAPTEMSEAYALVVNALIDHPEVWIEAQYFIDADMLQERRWYLFDIVRPEGRTDRDPSPAALSALADAVRETWRRGSFGLGRTVKFTYVLRNGRYEYYVAEVDDYPRDSREYTGTHFVSRLITPVCGIVLIFDREKGTVRVGTTVPLVKVPSIASNWARVVKDATLRRVRPENTKPLLDNLADPDRPMTLDADGQVESVRRSYIGATRFGKKTREIGLKEHESDDDALDGFQEDIARAGLTLEDFEFLEIKLAFVLRAPDGKSRRVTATVKQNGWSLGNAPGWAYPIVRERLRAWEVIDAVAA